MNAFRRLSRVELLELTGAKSRRRVELWMNQHGWVFELDLNNWPIVSASYAEEKLSGKSTTTKSRPNFAALRPAA